MLYRNSFFHEGTKKRYREDTKSFSRESFVFFVTFVTS